MLYLLLIMIKSHCIISFYLTFFIIYTLVFNKYLQERDGVFM